MKEVVIINQDSGYLMIDIANSFVEKGVNVSLITGRLVTRDTALNKSIRLRRIIKYDRKSTVKRLLSWVIGFLQILFIIKLKYRKAHLVIVTNPPFATFIPLLCKNEFSLIIFDVYPDALSMMKVINEKSWISKFWINANMKVFAKAHKTITLTESMGQLVSKYAGHKTIDVIPVWCNNSFIKPIPKNENPFVVENNLTGKFVVIYSGNLGVTHNVMIFADLAEKIKNQNIVFLIIGDGNQKMQLAEMISQKKLNNCILLPLQPVEKIPYSFAAGDLAIVSLGTNASGLSLPSKTFSFMSAGLPLLCIAAKGSELDKLVSRYENGVCFPPSDVEETASFIDTLASDRDLCARFKVNSLKASEHFTPQNAIIIADKVCE